MKVWHVDNCNSPVLKEQCNCLVHEEESDVFCKVDNLHKFVFQSKRLAFDGKDSETAFKIKEKCSDSKLQMTLDQKSAAESCNLLMAPCTLRPCRCARRCCFYLLTDP